MANISPADQPIGPKQPSASTPPGAGDVKVPALPEGLPSHPVKESRQAPPPSEAAKAATARNLARLEEKYFKKPPSIIAQAFPKLSKLLHFVTRHSYFEVPQRDHRDIATNLLPLQRRLQKAKKEEDVDKIVESAQRYAKQIQKRSFWQSYFRPVSENWGIVKRLEAAQKEYEKNDDLTQYKENVREQLQAAERLMVREDRRVVPGLLDQCEEMLRDIEKENAHMQQQIERMGEKRKQLLRSLGAEKREGVWEESKWQEEVENLQNRLQTEQKGRVQEVLDRLEVVGEVLKDDEFKPTLSSLKTELSSEDETLLHIGERTVGEIVGKVIDLCQKGRKQLITPNYWASTLREINKKIDNATTPEELQEALFIVGDFANKQVKRTSDVGGRQWIEFHQKVRKQADRLRDLTQHQRGGAITKEEFEAEKNLAFQVLQRVVQATAGELPERGSLKTLAEKIKQAISVTDTLADLLDSPELVKEKAALEDEIGKYSPREARKHLILKIREADTPVGLMALSHYIQAHAADLDKGGRGLLEKRGSHIRKLMREVKSQAKKLTPQAKEQATLSDELEAQFKKMWNSFPGVGVDPHAFWDENRRGFRLQVEAKEQGMVFRTAFGGTTKPISKKDFEIAEEASDALKKAAERLKSEGQRDKSKGVRKCCEEMGKLIDQAKGKKINRNRFLVLCVGKFLEAQKVVGEKRASEEG